MNQQALDDVRASLPTSTLRDGAETEDEGKRPHARMLPCPHPQIGTDSRCYVSPAVPDRCAPYFLLLSTHTSDAQALYDLLRRHAEVRIVRGTHAHAGPAHTETPVLKAAGAFFAWATENEVYIYICMHVLLYIDVVVQV